MSAIKTLNFQRVSVFLCRLHKSVLKLCKFWEKYCADENEYSKLVCTRVLSMVRIHTAVISSNEQDEAYLQRCRTNAKEVVKSCGWTVIHCADGDSPRTPEDIHQQVLKIVEDLI